MTSRKAITAQIETTILTRSLRRCALCFGLNNDTAVKEGQLAHLDRNRANSTEDNLAFLCLVHHDRYDSRTSQSKGLKMEEVRCHRERLYQAVRSGELHLRGRAATGARFELRRALLQGSAGGRQVAGVLEYWEWYFRAELYAVPPQGAGIVLPYHASSVVLEGAGDWAATIPMQNFSPQWDTTLLEWNGGDVLKHTLTELRVTDAGMMEAHAALRVSNPPMIAPDILAVTVHIQDAHQTTDSHISCSLVRLPGFPDYQPRWSWNW